MSDNKTKQGYFLCEEHGEEFLIEADSLADAQEGASVYGGKAIREVLVTKIHPNGKIEYV